MTLVTKYDVDQAVLNYLVTLVWLEGRGWRTAYGPDITYIRRVEHRIEGITA